jgi:hypothetical protein
VERDPLVKRLTLSRRDWLATAAALGWAVGSARTLPSAAWSGGKAAATSAAWPGNRCGWQLITARRKQPTVSRAELARMAVEFSVCMAGYGAAVRRASRLDVEAQAVDEAGRNLTIAVWQLTKSIRTHLPWETGNENRADRGTLGRDVCAAAEGSWDERRQKLGTPAKPYRILVDKVLMFANKWVMEPEHVAEIKATGFNVVVPRIGGDDNARVERVARMAMDQEMFYMPWIRGTHVERADPKLRVTSATGRYGALASPNADALWDYWRDRILFYARLSRDVPSVLGVFLDFENYDTARIGGGMHDFQVNLWRTRARELRKAVDELNPRFQFIVYPASQSLFIREVAWREWHTEQAPLVMAEVETYWRRAWIRSCAGPTRNSRARAPCWAPR